MISHNRNVLKTLAPTFLIEEDLRLYNLVFTLNLGTSKPLDGNESVNLPKEIQNLQTVFLLIVKYLPRFHCVVLSASGLYIIITGRGLQHESTMHHCPLLHLIAHGLNGWFLADGAAREVLDTLGRWSLSGGS